MRVCIPKNVVISFDLGMLPPTTQWYYDRITICEGGLPPILPVLYTCPTGAYISTLRVSNNEKRKKCNKAVEVSPALLPTPRFSLLSHCQEPQVPRAVS